MPQTTPVSLWDTSSQEPDIQSDALGDAVADVAVIGGGYTGLSTALHCGEKGWTVHVIEEPRIGHGESGRNVGLVNARFWMPPQDVRKFHGSGLLELFCKAPAFVFDLNQRRQIRCDVTKTGNIHAAHAPSGLRNLQARHAEWQRMGEPVDLLSHGQFFELTGTTPSMEACWITGPARSIR